MSILDNQGAWPRDFSRCVFLGRVRWRWLPDLSNPQYQKALAARGPRLDLDGIFSGELVLSEIKHAHVAVAHLEAWSIAKTEATCQAEATRQARAVLQAATERVLSRKQRSQTEWGDIPAALALIQEKLGVNTAVAGRRLIDACASGEVSSRFQHPSNWWLVRPDPVPPQAWQNDGRIDNGRLIHPSGRKWETDHWIIGINLFQLRDCLDKTIGKVAAEAAPVELPAPAPSPAPVTPPALIETVDGEQPKKQQTSGQPKPPLQPPAGPNRDEKHKSGHQAEHFPQPSGIRGPKTGKRKMVAARMKAEINDGTLTHEALAAKLEKELEADYGVSRDTVRKARKDVLTPPSD